MSTVHVTPVRTYLFVFAALMALTLLTVGVAHVNIAHHLPGQMTDAINDAVAMMIAVTKATLVILFFMGVAHSARINKVVVWSSFFFLLVLFAFSLADYFSRGWLGVPGK
ncbi:MAG: cytochrome C oxidase subunit IV family protein [Holophagales bacterium]|nr:cytochrome C oxidase subunit IV family protein [Holophagales bacterium]